MNDLDNLTFFSLLTNVYGAEQNISDVHVDGKEDCLEDCHDKELQGIQFSDDNTEWDENTGGCQPTLENTLKRSRFNLWMGVLTLISMILNF